MREEPLLTVAPAPIASLPEFYAIALHQAQLAARHYGAWTARVDESSEALRAIFASLAARESARADAITAACIAACGAPPDPKHLPAKVVDLVPAQELSDIAQSGLSTPYAAWALAVRHRQRAFIYWTYVAALARRSAVSAAAEGLAREALADGNLLRRERRLAWRNEHKLAADDRSGDRDASAALLESLLQRDIIAWSQTLPPAGRNELMHVGTMSPPPQDAAPLDGSETPVSPEPGPDEIERIKQRALRRAEQLSNVYLDEADKAKDQSSLDFAQKLAAHSIARLAGLRAAADAASEGPAR